MVMAVGKAGEAADRDKLKISFGGHVVAEKGQRAAKYDEKTATKAVSGREVEIAVDLGIGKGIARVWTCDLTHGYIDINGSYRFLSERRVQGDLAPFSNFRHRAAGLGLGRESPGIWRCRCRESSPSGSDAPW